MNESNESTPDLARPLQQGDLFGDGRLYLVQELRRELEELLLEIQGNRSMVASSQAN